MKLLFFINELNLINIEIKLRNNERIEPIDGKSTTARSPAI